MPEVSVIIPNYNHATFLEQRIESVLNQTCQDFELILLDDHSTDQSEEILRHYQHHPNVTQLVINTYNSGNPFHQWNTGVSLAKGRYVWIAESDDWADPEFLEILLKEAKRHDRVVLAFTLARYTNSQGKEQWKINESSEIIYYTGVDFIREFLVFYNAVYNVSMTLIHRETYLKLNFNELESMQLCGDWLLYTMLCMQGNVVSIGKALSNYRIHDNNSSASSEKQGRSFSEGFKILTYCRQHSVAGNWLKYSFFWARQWVKYEKKYCFSPDVVRKLRRQAFSEHRLVFFFYLLYRIYYQCKTNT